MSEQRGPRTLRVALSGTALEAEHARILRRLVRRGEELPERTPEDALQGEYGAQAVALARENWRSRMVHEHASAAVFSGLLPQLMAAGAPLDVKTTMTRCAIDELRHAGLCGQVVAFLGGEPEAPADLAVEPLPRHTDCTPQVSALRNALFASLCETVSVSLLTAEREQVTEPFIRRVLRQLSGDEVLHARVGWLYLGWSWPRLSPQERDQLRAYLPTAIGHLRREMLGAMPLGERPGEAIMEQARALGFSDSADTRALFDEVMASVIVPQLDAFELGAAAAWEAARTDA